jgi:transposase
VLTVVLARPCSGSPAFGCWPWRRRTASWSRRVETTATMAWCTGCGVRAMPHGRRHVRVRDLPSAGRAVTLLWLKRLWRCAAPACARRTWSETSEHVRPRSVLTERARREACRLVGEDGLDVATVAATLGVGWGTVMRAVHEYGQPLVDARARLAGVEAVGVDETALLAANATHPSVFVTGIVAMPGPGRRSAQLLDVMPGRTKAVVQQWFQGRDAGWRERITVCSLDPFRGYATALTTSLPHACASWTPSTSCAWARPRSTTCGGAGSKRRLAGAGTAMTRSTGPVGCCAATSPR